MIIGAAKAGTTTLARQLAMHPSLALSREKEPSFFSKDLEYAKGLEVYSANWASVSPQSKCFEASTQYTRYPVFPDVPERIREHLPHVKFVYLMSHPVERAYSQYRHQMIKELYPGRPDFPTFEQHLAIDSVCLNSSLYLMQIERYLDQFPREQMHFVVMDDLLANPANVIGDILAFVDVDPCTDIVLQGGLRRENDAKEFLHKKAEAHLVSYFQSRVPGLGALKALLPSSARLRLRAMLTRLPAYSAKIADLTPLPMLASTRARLLEFFMPHNERLGRFLKRDLSVWND
jgi:hypothetical protein